MPVLLHVPPDHGSVEDVEGRKQGCGAEPPLFERQLRLGPVERLNLAFLVEGQHDGVRGRIDIEPYNIVEFSGLVTVI
jgi:hypothetical protein